LCDAFSTLKNASREVGKIVYFMYARNKGDRVLACERKNKAVFKTLILDDPEIRGYLEHFKTHDKISKVKLYQSVMYMENEVPDSERDLSTPVIYEEDFYGSDISYESECDSDDNLPEMTIDPL
jgi:hypothetical protein